MRLDQLLLQRGLAPSRSSAQRLIERGAVRWRPQAGSPWQQARKTGVAVPEHAEIELQDDAELRHVSRGGLKLEGALTHTGARGMHIKGHLALDLGQSTGGFTDVLLKQGIGHVTGVDVGHGQIHPSLKAHPNVTVLEGINARHLTAEVLHDAGAKHTQFDLVTGDLSFISLTLVLPALPPLLKAGAQVLLLVKPQFELQPEHIGKGGLVKSERSYALVETRLRDASLALGWTVLDFFPSPITGGDGNTEFFLWATTP